MLFCLKPEVDLAKEFCWSSPDQQQTEGDRSKAEVEWVGRGSRLSFFWISLSSLLIFIVENSRPQWSGELLRTRTLDSLISHMQSPSNIGWAEWPGGNFYISTIAGTEFVEVFLLHRHLLFFFCTSTDPSNCPQLVGTICSLNLGPFLSSHSPNSLCSI